MRRKVFFTNTRSPTFEQNRGVVIKLSDLDEYKEYLVQLRKTGQLSVGKFRNRSTAINVFVEYLLRVKKSEVRVINEVRITAKDIYNAFILFIKERKPSLHTLRVYLYSTKKALEHILLSKYNILLSQVIGYEVFNAEFYLSNLSRSLIQDKSRRLKEYRENEKNKVITDERVKDGLKWLAILIEEKSTRSVENLRLATLIAIFTGARGTEINDLQFKVKVGNELIDQIDLKRGIIYFYRGKIKGDATKSFTPVFVHPLLTEELRISKRKYFVSPLEPLLKCYSPDKLFQRYYTPARAFVSKRKLDELYETNTWLQKYPPDKPILSLRAIRKYVDSYLQAKIFELADHREGTSLFGEGLTGLDNMRRYKNYFLGRAEGVDFLHYISVTEDDRYAPRYRQFTKLLFDGLIDKLMPELAYVLSEENRVLRKLLDKQSGRTCC